MISLIRQRHHLIVMDLLQPLVEGVLIFPSVGMFHLHEKFNDYSCRMGVVAEIVCIIKIFCDMDRDKTLLLLHNMELKVLISQCKGPRVNEFWFKV